MGNLCKSKLKDIFLLWIIVNVAFYVKGHPSFSVPADTIDFAQKIKGVEAASHVDHIPNILRSANNGANKITDGTDLRISTDARDLRTGSGEIKTMETFKPNVKVMEEDPLKSIPTAGQATALKAPGLIELHPFLGQHTAVRWNLGYLNPAQVRELSPDNLIRYVAERDLASAKEVQRLYERAQEYNQAEQRAFSVAAGKGRDQIRERIDESVLARTGKGTQLTTVQQLQRSARSEFIMGKLKTDPSERLQQVVSELQGAIRSYEEAYSTNYRAALKLTESFTPEALSKLTNKEYVRKAALFDKDVNHKNQLWLDIEERRSRAKSSSVFSHSRQEGDQMLKDKNQRIKEKAEDERELIDANFIQDNARKEVIGKEAKRTPAFEEADLNLKYLEKSVQKAKSAALRSADRFYKKNNFLKSSELRLKPWSLKDFLRKMFPWFFRRGRDGQSDNRATTTFKSSTGDGMIGNNPSDTV